MKMEILRTAKNLRYLLWREEVNRNNWVTQLASWAECDPNRAEALLTDAEIYDYEQERIAQIVNCSVEDLQYADLIQMDGVDVLLENIQYLIDSLAYGERKVLAKHIGVSSTTISRWRSGEQRPRETKLVLLCRYFGIPAGTDLAAVPLFLALSPISEKEQRDWLHRRIDRLNADTLRQLFPALERLLKKP